MGPKTIYAPVLAFSGEIPDNACAWAADLALARKATLVVDVGAPKPFFSFPETNVGAEAILQSMADNVRKAADESAAKLRAGLGERGLAVTTEVVQATIMGLLSHFARRARASDLAVVSEPGSATPLTSRIDLAEEILTGSGRPLVVVPAPWSRGARISRAMVAWDGGAKAARAIGDALPLLEAAATVEIVIVDELGKGEVSADTIAAHIARHCQSVTITTVPRGGYSIAEAISGHALAHEADLMVMGAYGHSRLREFVLGGVTAHMLRAPPCPTLLSL